MYLQRGSIPSLIQLFNTNEDEFPPVDGQTYDKMEAEDRDFSRACKIADLILEVIDYSDPNYQMHMDVTAKTLKELGAGSIPILYVMNKADKVMDEKLPVLRGESKIYLSAAQGEGIPELVKMIEDKLFAGFITMDLVIPYTEGQIENDLRERARVLETKYEEDGIHMKADLNQEMLKRYRVYLV